MSIHFSLAVSVLAIAGFVQGLTGFGFGLVAMALLPSLVDYPVAYILVVIFTIPTSLVNLLRNRRHFHWRKGWVLLAGMCCGVPVGVYLVAAAPREMIIRLLGIVLIAFAINEVGFSQKKLQLPQWSGFPVGIASGVLGGAFNTGGPPSVAYLYSRPWRKEEIVAVLQVTFITSAVMRLCLFGAQGLGAPGAMSLTLWAALPVLTAVGIGTHYFRRIAQEPLRIGVFWLIGVMGFKYVLWP